MQIANLKHTAGARRRREIDYSAWLEEGRTLNTSTGFSAVMIAVNGVAPPADVTVDTVTVTADKLYFFVSGGSVNETFTVQVQITDTLGEILIDTIVFTVVAP